MLTLVQDLLNMKSSSDIVKSGNLGYMNFPPVEGKGHPSDTVGNPGQHNSISSKASAAQQDIAKKFVPDPGGGPAGQHLPPHPARAGHRVRRADNASDPHRV